MNLKLILQYNSKLNPWFFAAFIGTVAYSLWLPLGPSFWLLCYGIYFITFFFGVCLSLHRVIAHSCVQLPRILLYPWTLIGSLAHVGTPLEWYLGHSLHHQYSDSPKDPILPTLKGFNHMFGVYQPISHQDSMQLLFKAKNESIMKDTFLLSLSKYFYVYLGLIYLLVVGLSGFVSFLAFFIGTMSAMVATSFLTHWSHLPSLGYRNFNLPDKSTNLILLLPIFFGEELHNNHHGKPKSATNSTRWWEIDLIGQVLLVLLFVLHRNTSK